MSDPDGLTHYMEAAALTRALYGAERARAERLAEAVRILEQEIVRSHHSTIAGTFQGVHSVLTLPCPHALCVALREERAALVALGEGASGG